MASRNIRADSTEYLHITLTADHDITSDTVDVSLDAGANWHTAEHVTGGVRLLVGPGASPAIALPDGINQVLVRIHDVNETPVLSAGTIFVTS